MGTVRLGINKVTITTIDVLVMYSLVLFLLVKNNFIFHKGIIKKSTIIFQSIIDTHHFGGDVYTVELQISILVVWVVENSTKRVINRMIWIITPCWPSGVFILFQKCNYKYKEVLWRGIYLENNVLVF